MKAKYLKLRWKLWEHILVFTGWLFGYNHSAYHGVKDSRNRAYFDYMFKKDRR